MHEWRRQVGHRHVVAAQRGPRPFAILGFKTKGEPDYEANIALPKLTLIAVFDAYDDHGELQTRVVGVGGALESGHLRFGGDDLARFDKDLRLAPTAGGRGHRFDAGDGELLALALRLERHLERCARHPHYPRRRSPRLPLLAADQGAAVGEAIVNLTSLPKRQVLAFDTPARDLVGRSGVTSFDFVHTRFHAAD
jgi:hypothetical protein